MRTCVSRRYHIGRGSAATGRLRLLSAEPTGKPSAGLDPNQGCARSSSAGRAQSLALSPTQALASAGQPNGIGGPYQNPEPPSKPTVPARAAPNPTPRNG